MLRSPGPVLDVLVSVHHQPGPRLLQRQSARLLQSGGPSGKRRSGRRRFHSFRTGDQCGRCAKTPRIQANSTSQIISATGAKHAPTISQAPTILKAILRTDVNGTSTSVILTAVPGGNGGGTLDPTFVGVAVAAAGSSVPYFKVGRNSSIVRHSANCSNLQAYVDSRGAEQTAAQPVCPCRGLPDHHQFAGDTISFGRYIVQCRVR